MKRFEPIRVFWRDNYLRFYDPNGIEYQVHGDESRVALTWEVIDQLEDLTARAIRLLESFMKDRGVFDLESVETLATTMECADVVLRFVFTPDAGDDKYGYTYFDVVFSQRKPPQPPFWPIRFTVGFH